MEKIVIKTESANSLVKESLPSGLDVLVKVLLGFVLSISIFGLLSALLDIFHARSVFILGVIGAFVVSCGSIDRTPRVVADAPVAKYWYLIFLLLLVGVFFRSEPFNYVFGGQDQGVYINMASHINRTGSIAAIDPVIDDIDAQFLERYQRDNYPSPGYLPGVYSKRDSEGIYKVEFQFYHLFPVWLATFEGIFGPQGSGYALIFLSLLSLIFCYCLVRVVTGSDKLSFAASFLLAVNPLHSFFSKWPVTEVPTLTFSLAGFLCLAVVWVREREALTSWGYLALSILSFGCIFFTRISGFMYLPVFFAIVAVAMVMVEEKKSRFVYMVWGVGVLSLYGISVWYGLNWSGTYARDIYRISFSKIFGSAWVVGVAAIGLAFASALVAIFVFSSFQAARVRLKAFVDWAGRCIGWVFVVVLVIGMAKIFALAFTREYVGDPWIGQLWGLANNGLQSIASSSIVVAAISVSPVIFFIFMVAMLVGNNNVPVNFLKLFLLSIFSYLALLQFTVPYQPYYDRYVVSEFVPFVILLAVVFVGSSGSVNLARIAPVLFVFAVLSSSYWSMLHVGKEEQRGAYTNLHEAVSVVGSNDLLLLYGDDLWGQVKTPLVYKFGKKVASISSESMGDRDYLEFIASKYDRVFLISSKEFTLDDWSYLGSRRVTYDAFERGRLPASRIATKTKLLQLYEYKSNRLENGVELAVSDFTGSFSEVGKISDGILEANGKEGFLLFGPYVAFPKGLYKLKVAGISNLDTDAWVDVVSQKGKKRHGYFPVEAGKQKNGDLVNGIVRLDESVTDLEVRVFVSENHYLGLEYYRFQRVGS